MREQYDMWVSRYTLTPGRALNPVARPGPREGALIRSGDGSADVYPWPELGDAPLDEQLARLARGETTPLTRQTLHFAEIDGAARARGASLFDGLEIPASHWPGNDPPQQCDTAKVKGARDLPDRVRLRLDFNATLSADEFERIAATLPRQRIDFVEDPCPYDAPAWKRLRARTGLRLALDRGFETSVDVLVMKPAVQDVDSFITHPSPQNLPEIVITSYIDHALGQIAAAGVAAKHTHAVSARCGLFTHVLFEPDAFFERIRADGPRLLPPPGTGFGFDNLLEKLPWEKLA